MIKSIHFPPPTSDDMVRAILDNRKTVTRRVVKQLPEFDADGGRHELILVDSRGLFAWKDHPNVKLWAEQPYRPGDILYVRETWASWTDLFDEFPEYIYRADYTEESLRMDDDSSEIVSDFPACVKWHSSIHMPREAARIFLRVTDVRVERLQWCGNAQAKDEGCTCCSQFIRIWNSTIKNRARTKYSWEADPWVWVIEFERCEKPKEE